jgi:hypothetical protein
VADGNRKLMEQLRQLREIDVRNDVQVHQAIEALEIIKNRQPGWIASFRGSLNEEDMDCFLEMYCKHLLRIKKFEGVSFERTETSYRMCLRMLQVIFGMLYEVFDGENGLPDEIRGIV